MKLTDSRDLPVNARSIAALDRYELAVREALADCWSRTEEGGFYVFNDLP